MDEKKYFFHIYFLILPFKYIFLNNYFINIIYLI